MKLPLPSISQVFLSTPSARRATRTQHAGRGRSQISIHALREEGDPARLMLRKGMSNFYPRPPRGGRRLVRYEKPVR